MGHSVSTPNFNFHFPQAPQFPSFPQVSPTCLSLPTSCLLFCVLFWFCLLCFAGGGFCLVTLTECSDLSENTADLAGLASSGLVLCWDQSCCEPLSECHGHIYDQMTGSLSLSVLRDLIVVSETWPLIGLYMTK